MSVYSDFWTAVIDQLQTRLTLSGESGYASISTDAIVLRHLPLRLDPQSKWADEKTPGIIVSPAYSLTREGGTNATDWWHYPLLIQIIDTCHDRYNAAQLASWVAWEEKIAKYFHHGNARQAAWSAAGYLFQTWVDSTDLFDEQRYAYHHQMKMALSLVGRAECPRDPNGVL